MRDAVHGVQRVDERVAVGVRVHRVRPSAVASSLVRLTGKPCITQPFCDLSAMRPGINVCELEVVGPDDVVLDVLADVCWMR